MFGSESFYNIVLFAVGGGLRSVKGCLCGNLICGCFCKVSRVLKCACTAFILPFSPCLVLTPRNFNNLCKYDVLGGQMI